MTRERRPARPVAPRELVALRDGTLSPDEEADVHERIADDPAAAALLRDLDVAEVVLRRVRGEGMPADVAARIERALAEEARRRPER
jgi:negative regulator of sigma E activity